ncbi:hypothetical protein [Hyalangium rubrum]|uniref:Uncharacterized protein n=1 Tax=Hyalangium rubrum TaxID=3103134 RepID=A0ABU5GVR0_9BACT|nr:hypothetical protein [Hyalangium sp. s54d21]MDY7225273.1 hypothetical protein [Hyalangium sp. s54d21]
MEVLNRILSRFTGGWRGRASALAPTVARLTPASGPRPLNPVAQAFLGGEVPKVKGEALDEDEACLIRERWKDQGAYAVSNTGKLRMTRKHFWWRQRVEALLVLPPKTVKDKVEAWRRWLGEYEAHAQGRLLKYAELPKDPGPIPSELALQLFQSEPLGEPPLIAFRFIFSYQVTLPDGSQVTFRDDPVQLDDKYLVQESGVIKTGLPICGRADVDELFDSAGITDATERKVMKKVAEGLGGFETINTCDPGCVCAGFVPLISGESGEGSLAQLLRSMKAANPSEFDVCFRSLGLDVDKQALRVVQPDSGKLLRGREAVCAIVEDKRLAALFYNAGKKSRAYQVAQLRLARELYYLAPQDFTLKALVGSGDKAVWVTFSGKYGDVLRSEAGKAALMDRAVQRGVGNARQTFKEACLTVIQEKGLSSVEALARYEVLITPVLQSPGKDRLRVLEDKDLSQPAAMP